VEASCVGLIILSTNQGATCLSDVAYYSVSDPATRQYAPLPQLCGFCIAGMYRHHPTGEYRLLLYPDVHDEPEPSAGYDCYVYALGSCEPPRDIGWPAAEEVIRYIRSVFFRGRLHWFIKKDESQSCMVTVFDTTAELFRQMRAPAVPGFAELFEMDEMLGMASFDNWETPIDIWMTQDYDSEVWAFKYRVELPVADLTVRFRLDKFSKLVVASWDDGGGHILVKCGEWLLQIGMDGKLVASFHRGSLRTTEFRLKQSLVPHAFFPKIEGYVVNSWPFISPDDHAVNT
jgi:F-box interacting protein